MLATNDKTMTRDEQWHKSCEAVRSFVEANLRRPSKYKSDERAMHNWLKFNRKLLNHGLLDAARLDSFRRLEELIQQYRRVNQYK